MIFDDNSKIILSNLHKNLCCGCSILMSTHNIGFYEEISKIITLIIIIKYHQIRTLFLLLVTKVILLAVEGYTNINNTIVIRTLYQYQ